MVNSYKYIIAYVFIENIEDWTFVSYDKPLALPVLALQSASLCEVQARGAYIFM